MKVVATVEELLAERRDRGAAATGFVPTMGALHAGHLALVARSRAECERTWASIFVNPAQFDERADLERYPRSVEEDLAKLREEGVDLAFLPGESEIYPDGYRYRVTEGKLSRRMEGASRPGHFDGVLTVVLKLLLLVRPARAYFGEKDWQQLRLVEGLSEAFFTGAEIVACPTVREPDGLALSSRNRRLPPEARALAPEFHRVLAASVAGGATAEDAARQLGERGFAVDYVEDAGDRRLGAVRLGNVRLIDNVRRD